MDSMRLYHEKEESCLTEIPIVVDLKDDTFKEEFALGLLHSQDVFEMY